MSARLLLKKAVALWRSPPSIPSRLQQTPQAASIALLKKLYGRIAAEPLDFTPTDEASILEYFGESVYIVKGNNLNDKLTTPEDFEIFASRAR